jgi:hypothetical protein
MPYSLASSLALCLLLNVSERKERSDWGSVKAR